MILIGCTTPAATLIMMFASFTVLVHMPMLMASSHATGPRTPESRIDRRRHRGGLAGAADALVTRPCSNGDYGGLEWMRITAAGEFLDRITVPATAGALDEGNLRPSTNDRRTGFLFVSASRVRSVEKDRRIQLVSPRRPCVRFKASLVWLLWMQDKHAALDPVAESTERSVVANTRSHRPIRQATPCWTPIKTEKARPVSSAPQAHRLRGCRQLLPWDQSMLLVQQSLGCCCRNPLQPGAIGLNVGVAFQIQLKSSLGNEGKAIISRRQR